MCRVSVGWKDQLAALKHVFPQFPTDTRHIWQRPHADFKVKSRVKNNPTQYTPSHSIGVTPTST
ncbi:hypothetical protein SAMN04515618_10383 [Collimonas sp. OK307]|nr:hypothetical protein SAMN04515618_10383 [Collimonas sp. OK307]